MHFVIKNPAPRGDDAHRWGDEYFGRALEDALVEAGCSVRQDFWPDWDQAAEDAVVLVLRGARAWLPPKAGFRILWIISHPTVVTDEELAHYDLVLAASRVHARLLASRTKTPCRVALQCTDERVFYPPQTPIESQPGEREGTVYVANTRGIRRDMGQWLVESGHKARIFGRAWEYCGLGHLVEGQHLPNPEVAELYRRSRLALNDHWLDMRGLGYINNRLFDCLACGIPVLTDDSPEVRAVFGDALLYAGSAEEFEAAVQACERDYAAVLRRVSEAWQRLAPDFTFRARARELIDWVERPPDTGKPKLVPARPPLERRLEELLRSNVRQSEAGALHLQRTLRQNELALDKETKRLEEADRKHAQAQDALQKARHQYETVARERDEALREQGRSEQREAAAESARKAAEEQVRLASVVLRHNERLERSLQSLITSASWRLTAPLRLVTGLLRLVVRGRRGSPVHSVPKRPPEVAQLRDRLGLETQATGSNSTSRRVDAGGTAPTRPPSLRTRLVPVARKALRVATRSTQRLRERASAYTAATEPGRSAAGTQAQAGDADHGGDGRSEDAAYWRLQACQLLEELEYLRANPDTVTGVTGAPPGGTDKAPPQSSPPHRMDAPATDEPPTKPNPGALGR